MFRKILFIGLILLMVSSALGLTKFNKVVLASSYTIDASAQRQILEATVRITLFAPLADEQGNLQYVTVDGQLAIQYTVGEGLGTLTRSGTDVFIVTHDHWSLLTSNLTKVQFHNVANELLLEVSGAEFEQMLRYRDGGTILLDAPDELLVWLTAVPAGDSSAVGRNDIVYLAYRQPGGGAINVAAMLVKKETSYKGRPVFRLIGLNDEFVVDGNSGGGVLFNGKLIGNMWGTILEQELSQPKGAGNIPLKQTSSSLAAKLPLSIAVQ